MAAYPDADYSLTDCVTDTYASHTTPPFMALHAKLLTSILVLVIISLEANGARIIGVLSTDSKSRYANLRNLAEELGLRKHEVLLIVPSVVPRNPSKVLKHSTYNIQFVEDYMENVIVPMAFSQTQSNLMEVMQMWAKYFAGICSSLVSHVRNHFNDWKEFDLIVADAPPECGAVISDLLALPRVDIYPAALAFRFHRGIGPVSYIPHAHSQSNDKMNFIERLQNIFHTLIIKVVLRKIYYPPFDELKKRFDIAPERTFQESMNMAELVIIMGHFALEYAQPVLPDTKLVGPLTIKPPKKLPLELESFVSGAGDRGVVIFSLGTLGDAVLQKHHVDILAGALGRLEQRVVWRLRKHIPLHLPPNVKVFNWIPQNDLLAHKRTKVFISHTGHNSLYESAFYGVPLVCIPLFVDQFSNCLQAQSVGIAVGVDIKSVSEEELYQKIQLVLNTPSFQGNATRISNLMHDSSRTPVQQAADWIEYVNRHGGARHLKPQVYNLYWYQEYLLDIGAFLLSVTVALLVVIRVAFKFLCKIC